MLANVPGGEPRKLSSLCVMDWIGAMSVLSAGGLVGAVECCNCAGRADLAWFGTALLVPVLVLLVAAGAGAGIGAAGAGVGADAGDGDAGAAGLLVSSLLVVSGVGSLSIGVASSFCDVDMVTFIYSFAVSSRFRIYEHILY